MQSIDSIETHAYGMSKDLVSEKEVVKCNNIIKKYKNDYLWWVYKEKREEHNPNWPQIPNNSYRILIMGG